MDFNDCIDWWRYLMAELPTMNDLLFYFVPFVFFVDDGFREFQRHSPRFILLM